MHFLLKAPEREYVDSVLHTIEELRHLPSYGHPNIYNYMGMRTPENYQSWARAVKLGGIHAYGGGGVWLIVLDDEHVEDNPTVVGFIGFHDGTKVKNRRRNFDFAMLPEYENAVGYMALAAAACHFFAERGTRKKFIYFSVCHADMRGSFNMWVLSNGGTVEVTDKANCKLRYKIPIEIGAKA